MTGSLSSPHRPAVRPGRIIPVAVVGGMGAAAAAATGQGAPTTVIAALLGCAGAAGWSAVGRIRPTAGPARRRAPAARAVLLAIAVPVVVVLLAAAVGLAVAPAPFLLAPGQTSQYRPEVVLGLVAVMLGLVVGARAAYDLRSAPRPSIRTAVIVALLVLGLAVQLRLAWAVLQFPPYDATQIFSAAYSASVAPTPQLFGEAAQSAYFAMLPNNAFLAAAWSVVFDLLRMTGVSGVQTYLWITVVVNCIAIDVAVLLVWFCARRIGSRFTTAVTMGAAVVLLVLSPWLDVPYSDTLGLAFPIGVVALFLAWPDTWRRASRLGLWACIGAITAVGYSVKPTVVFAAAGLLVCEALRSRAPLRRRALEVLAPAAVFGVLLLVGHIASTRWIDATGVLPFSMADNHGGLPFTHFMAMGATGDGGYNQADVDSSLATPTSERSGADLTLFLSRVTEMGPLGYPLFLGKKLLVAFSDGSFFQGREGVGPYDRSFLQHDGVSTTLQSIYPDFTPLHWILSSTWQAAWIVVLLLCFVPLGRTLPESRRPIVAALRVGVLLLLTFLLFSESRSRYLYLYLPFILVLAGLGARSFTDGVARAVARFHPRRP